jgi:hypothetical protein
LQLGLGIALLIIGSTHFRFAGPDSCIYGAAGKATVSSHAALISFRRSMAWNPAGYKAMPLLNLSCPVPSDIHNAESFCDVVSTLAYLSVFSSLIISVAQVGGTAGNLLPGKTCEVAGCSLPMFHIPTELVLDSPQLTICDCHHSYSPPRHAACLCNSNTCLQGTVSVFWGAPPLGLEVLARGALAMAWTVLAALMTAATVQVWHQLIMRLRIHGIPADNETLLLTKPAPVKDSFKACLWLFLQADHHDSYHAHAHWRHVGLGLCWSMMAVAWVLAWTALIGLCCSGLPCLASIACLFCWPCWCCCPRAFNQNAELHCCDEVGRRMHNHEQPGSSKTAHILAGHRTHSLSLQHPTYPAPWCLLYATVAMGSNHL